MDFRRPLSVITPTLDGDVLAVLAKADSSFSARAVHRLVGHSSETGVRRALERLSRQGIVTMTPAGKAYLCQLNRKHLAARSIETLAQPRTRLLEELADQMNSWATPAVYAAIFGSVARGEAGEESDLDLFVIRPDDIDGDDPTWQGQLTDLTLEATAMTGNDARVLEYSAAEVARLSDVEEVLQDISKEGLTIIGDREALAPRRRAK